MPGKVVTIKDLTGKWADDLRYAEKIAARGNAIFTDLPDQKEDPVATMPTIPVIWTPVPKTNPNHPTSFLTHDKKWITWHENGNPRSDAVNESNFLLGGGGEGRVSYHLAVDHEVAYQMFALDQLCWHAGDGCNDPDKDIGCFGSVAIEHCQDRDQARWAATKRNGAILTAMIIAGHPDIHFGTAKGDFSADRIAPHQKWSGKNCPEWMLREGALPGQIKLVKELLKTGEEPPPPGPGPDYPEGLDKGVSEWIFGTIKVDGTTYSFNENGPVSQAWLIYGKARGYTRLIDVWKLGDGREYFLFGGFTLFRPNGSTPFSPLGGA
jgi:hypothetical protein